jgi:uncharacterized phage-associated protein
MPACILVTIRLYWRYSPGGGEPGASMTSLLKTDLIKPNDVANFLLDESRERGDILTNLKLQKLIYYAQAWYLALKEKPLFQEDLEAWVHGPVLPTQYYRFRNQKWMPILDDTITRPEVANPIKSHLLEIVDVFGSETAVSLELMTHRERPWIEARKDLAPDVPSNAIISKETMRDYYKSLK